MTRTENSVHPELDHATGPDSSPARWERIGIVLVVAVAAVVRIGVCLARSDSLADDLDAYVGLAERLAAGAGFVDADGSATAYRPPLYPLLLAVPVSLFGTAAGVATVNVACGTATVGATWALGRRLGLGRAALIAAGMVAFDPLLVLYTTYAMTETVFTLLTTLLLCTAAGLGGIEPASRRHTFRFAGTGAVFGLAALCRPTIWAFGFLAAGIWLVRVARRKTRSFRGPAVAALAAVVVVSPWVVRNAVVFGRPILMTTHGGYTLLLANNPVFYDEVVREPWGTVWRGESLRDWQRSLEEEMRAANPPVTGELARNRWHRDRALGHVADDPDGFLQASWLRLRRFWNPAPLTAAASVPAAASWLVTAWNALAFAAAVAGLFRLAIASRRERRLAGSGPQGSAGVAGSGPKGRADSLPRRGWHRWWPALTLVVALTGVHTVYWSNARMRAPLIPIVALLAGRAITRRDEPRREEDAGRP